MPFTTRRPALRLAADEKQELEGLGRSRTGEKRRALHAAILLDSSSGMSDGAVARSNGVTRHTVALCVRKFLHFGLEAALGDCRARAKSAAFQMMPLPGFSIVPVRSRAFGHALWPNSKSKALGYAEELRTFSLLQSHVRKRCTEAGHPSLIQLSPSRLHRFLTQGETRPHKIRYDVERRDPEFESGMAVVGSNHCIGLPLAYE